MLKGVKKIQRLWVVRKEVRHFQLLRKAVRRIQSWWVAILFKKRLMKAKKASRKIQAFLQMANKRVKHLKKVKSSELINRLMRGVIARRFVRKIRTIEFAVEVINFFGY